MERNPSHDELRLACLLDQFLALSDDQDNAGRIIFRGPHGEYIGEATLSARDIEAATDVLDSLNRQRQDLEESTRPADPLPQVDTEDVNEVVTALENLLANGGEQL